MPDFILEIDQGTTGTTVHLVVQGLRVHEHRTLGSSSVCEKSKNPAGNMPASNIWN